MGTMEYQVLMCTCIDILLATQILLSLHALDADLFSCFYLMCKLSPVLHDAFIDLTKCCL